MIVFILFTIGMENIEGMKKLILINKDDNFKFSLVVE